jgi:hypothetical protein
MVGMWMQMYAGLIVDNFGPPGIGETLLKFYRNFGNLLTIHLLCGIYTNKLITNEVVTLTFLVVLDWWGIQYCLPSKQLAAFAVTQNGAT